jgi:hypothetical protein
MVADVVRIETPKVGGDKDGVDAGALCVGIDRETLSRAGGVRECVRIVMVRSRITKDRARRSRRTGLRNTAMHELISLRWIAIVDTSINHDRRAGRATSRRRRSRGCGCWGWGRRAAAAQPCYSQSIVRTPCVGSDFAHDHHERLSIGNLNLERSVWIRAEA